MTDGCRLCARVQVGPNLIDRCGVGSHHAAWFPGVLRRASNNVAPPIPIAPSPTQKASWSVALGVAERDVASVV
jgi:hypothetical protein